jgi:RNA polymerase sigma factor (sigma-70 family)
MGGIQFNRDYFSEYQQYLMRLGEDNTKTRERLLINLRRAIREELTEKEWQAMQMYYVREIRMTDIARELGVNISTVSRNISRGRKKLKRCLRYGAKELLEPEEE